MVGSSSSAPTTVRPSGADEVARDRSTSRSGPASPPQTLLAGSSFGDGQLLARARRTRRPSSGTVDDGYGTPAASNRSLLYMRTSAPGVGPDAVQLAVLVQLASGPWAIAREVDATLREDVADRHHVPLLDVARVVHERDVRRRAGGQRRVDLGPVLVLGQDRDLQRGARMGGLEGFLDLGQEFLLALEDPQVQGDCSPAADPPGTAEAPVPSWTPPGRWVRCSASRPRSMTAATSTVTRRTLMQHSRLLHPARRRPVVAR